MSLFGSLFCNNREVLAAIFSLKEIVMTTKQEVLDAVAGIGAQLTKAKGEIVQKIADLEAQVAAGAGMDEVLAALSDIKTSAQGLDDVVPDVPTP